MTDLILEYGNSFPVVPNLSSEEIRLFNNVRHPNHYFSLCQNGDFIINKSFFDVSKRVLDVHRYDLVHINNEWKLIYPNTTSQDCCCCEHKDTVIDPNKNNILVILESPHKDEYCSCCFKPLVPANGATGTNFCNYFTSHVLTHVIKNLNHPLKSILEKDKKYSICFVNPVPFQTSLHFINKKNKRKLTDKVWIQLFPLCLVDFITRINNYSGINPVIILNSCTGDATKPKTLKYILKGAIDTAISNQQINCTDKFNTYHPSAWFDNNLILPNLCTQW